MRNKGKRNNYVDISMRDQRKSNMQFFFVVVVVLLNSASNNNSSGWCLRDKIATVDERKRAKEMQGA